MMRYLFLRNTYLLTTTKQAEDTKKTRDMIKPGTATNNNHRQTRSIKQISIPTTAGSNHNATQLIFSPPRSHPIHIVHYTTLLRTPSVHTHTLVHTYQTVLRTIMQVLPSPPSPPLHSTPALYVTLPPPTTTYLHLPMLVLVLVLHTRLFRLLPLFTTRALSLFNSTVYTQVDSQSQRTHARTHATPYRLG